MSSGKSSTISSSIEKKRSTFCQGIRWREIWLCNDPLFRKREEGRGTGEKNRDWPVFFVARKRGKEQAKKEKEERR